MKKNKEHIVEELQELQAENLLKHKESMQDIPADYFENLSKDFLASVQGKEDKAPTKTVSFRKVFLSLSIAAALLVLLAIPLFNSNANVEEVNWDQLSSTDIENYIEENIYEFSDEEIASVIALSDNSIFMETEFSDEILEEYLTEMDIEETLF